MYKEKNRKYMAADKKHDYHLVDPSPWPIFCSFAL